MSEESLVMRRVDRAAFFGVMGFVSGGRNAKLLRLQAKASYSVQFQINKDIHGNTRLSMNAMPLCSARSNLGGWCEIRGAGL